jgi:hypothetical protein
LWLGKHRHTLLRVERAMAIPREHVGRMDAFWNDIDRGG